MERHSVFFSKLSDMKEIYSYGSSFFGVDMVYIDRISRIVDPSKAT